MARHGDNSPENLHREFARGVVAGTRDRSTQIGFNPAVSEKQRKFFGAALGRKRRGESRAGDPDISEEKLREFARKRKKR